MSTPEEPMHKQHVSYLDRLHPCDPFDEVTLQFGALRKLGYPVDLELAGPPDPQPSDTEYERWLSKTFRRWVRPQILVPEFRDWLHPIGIPDRFVLDKLKGGLFAELLTEHPVNLIADSIDGFVEEPEQNIIDFMIHEEIEGITPADDTILSEDLLEKLFMTACMRNGFFTNFSCPAERDELGAITQSTYDELGDKNQQPARPAELESLVKDYYRIVAFLFPEFEAFRAS